MENSNCEIVVTKEGEITSLSTNMQIYQAIYNEITGKTEIITDSYKNFLILDMNDIFQLKYKLDQFLEQYHVSAFNTSITIFHVKASKERFSSFDRLHTYNTSNTSPIERINIEINFLLAPPKLTKPQNYKVTINLISGAALIAKSKPDIPTDIPGMIIMRAIQRKAVEVEIEYIDYIIARSISDLIREWIGSIKEQEVNEKLQSTQKMSHYFARFCELTFFSLALITSFFFAKVFLSTNTVQSVLLAQFILISGSSIILSKQIGLLLGRNIERKIDSINTNSISFICINSGDKKQYTEFQNNIKLEKWEAWKSGIIALGIGICSSIIATIIYNAHLS